VKHRVGGFKATHPPFSQVCDSGATHGNVKGFMKKNEKKRPTEYTEGHRTFFVMISFYFFCVSRASWQSHYAE
jgi:hypothetical protein